MSDIVEAINTNRDKKIIRILYADNSIEDTKLTAYQLENNTSTLRNDIGLLMFTVVSNKFTGLEYTQTTFFDCIIVDEDSDDESLTSFEFLSALRSVGVKTPIGMNITLYASIYLSIIIYKLFK
jgi:hypothetical protein